MDYNKVVLIGRLTRDPEIRQTLDGKLIGNFTIAVNRGGNRDEADFIKIVAFSKLAELVRDYLAKGRQVLVEGKLRINKWQTNDGQNRSTPEIWADNIVFLGSKREQNGEVFGSEIDEFQEFEPYSDGQKDDDIPPF